MRAANHLIASCQGKRRSGPFPTWSVRLLLACLLSESSGVVGRPAVAQEAAARTPSSETPATAASRFAPGVVTTIPATLDRQDAILVHDLVELRANPTLKWEPVSNPESRTLYEMARQAPFLQDLWCLELAFKPLRMIEVDVPQASGRMQRKLVWYLVYRVRNTGVGLTATVQPDGTFVTADKGVEPLRFLPQFVLSSKDRNPQGEPERREYLDRLIPAAQGPIQRREFSGARLLNSVEMAAQELTIESGRTEAGAWGVAMWEEVDPQIDFFSVEVGGLSNAYRWEDPPGAYRAGDPPGSGRRFQRRVLQLNFWRPGDEFDANEREIRLGAAEGKGDYYEGGEGVAYRWVFR